MTSGGAPRAPSLVPSPGGRTSAATGPAQGLDRLTLAEALALADRVHPELAVGQAQIARAEGRALQAGLFPNPELVARIESRLLTGAPHGAGSMSLGSVKRCRWESACRSPAVSSSLTGTV